MVMAEPAYASAGPIRVDRRAADRRRGAAALLAAVTSGLAVTRDTVFARARFEQVLANARAGAVHHALRGPDRAGRRRRDVLQRARGRAASSRASRGRVRAVAHARWVDLPAPRHGDAHRRAHPGDRTRAGTEPGQPQPRGRRGAPDRIEPRDPRRARPHRACGRDRLHRAHRRRDLGPARSSSRDRFTS